MSGINQISPTEEVVEWVERRNREVEVKVERVPFADLKGWLFDRETGDLVHETGRFFSITGLDAMTNTGTIARWQQPIINQPEVGYLGIIAKEFGGVLHFLLQAKIEPGNVNCVQLSPTLQATRSNYTRVHGGRKPAYLEYFQQARSGQILVDQLQSEQGSRFLRKRNRNIVIRVEDEVPVGEDFRWLTLEQIKMLARRDNFINMDTRTVLSGFNSEGHGTADARARMTIDEILHRLSELKTKYELVANRIPLSRVRDWTVGADEIARADRRFFRVIGVNVTIANREVSSWCQPLVEPMQGGLCVLFARRFNGVTHYLLQAKVECGNFDVVELAPTIQCLTGNYEHDAPEDRPRFVNEFVEGRIRGKVVFDVLQSEEGGRFYHEQNRNVLVELDEDYPVEEHENFLWLTMPQIKEFLRFNNYLNIQVRSLISMI